MAVGGGFAFPGDPGFLSMTPLHNFGQPQTFNLVSEQ